MKVTVYWIINYTLSNLYKPTLCFTGFAFTVHPCDWPKHWQPFPSLLLFKSIFISSMLKYLTIVIEIITEQCLMIQACYTICLHVWVIIFMNDFFQTQTGSHCLSILFWLYASRIHGKTRKNSKYLLIFLSWWYPINSLLLCQANGSIRLQLEALWLHFLCLIYWWSG